jgi:Fe-S cluster assembly ATP-binding protein
MLKIKNITAVSESNPLLQNVNLEIKAGEIHAVMGPKHSGKSALAQVIAGHPSIQITEGTITFKRKKIESLEAELRYRQGIFVTAQHPPEFDSLTNWELIEELYGKDGSDISDLQLKYTACCELLEFSPDHGDHISNSMGMTASASKRNELIHMILSDPKMIIIDEIDVGLSDKDAVLVAILLKDYLRNKDRGFLIITHSQTLLKILEPTHVHLMVAGEIKMSGDTELYTRIIEDGYSELS